MAALISPNILRVGLLLAIVSAHIQWQHLVNTLVPAPYLDEVFHVPQAQAYWAGRWGYWDDKITTPPGLYVFSYGINFIRNLFSTEGVNSTSEDLRFANAILLVLLLVLMYAWTAAGRREVNDEAVMQREFAIVVFPLFFFFSGLYYTDLLGVVLVLAAYVAWNASGQTHGRTKLVYQALHLVTGLLALGARQTNVFWVAVFLGGLQVVETVRKSVGVDKIHDPPIAEAFFEGKLGQVCCVPVTDMNRFSHHLHLDSSTRYWHSTHLDTRAVAFSHPSGVLCYIRSVEWWCSHGYESPLQKTGTMY